MFAATTSVLQGILALTRPCPHKGLGARDATYAVFELLEELLGSDLVSFQDMQAGRRPGRRYYLQATEAGEHLLMDEEQLAQSDHDNDDPLLADHWWQLPCSLLYRTGVPRGPPSRCSSGGNHPAQDYLRCADEILLAWPVGGGRSRCAC